MTTTPAAVMLFCVREVCACVSWYIFCIALGGAKGPKPSFRMRPGYLINAPGRIFKPSKSVIRASGGVEYHGFGTFDCLIVVGGSEVLRILKNTAGDPAIVRSLSFSSADQLPSECAFADRSILPTICVLMSPFGAG